MRRGYLLFCLCLPLSLFAQQGHPSSKLSFSGEGTSYSFDNSDPAVSAIGEMNVKNNIVTMVSLMFTNAANLDTIIILAADQNGLKAGQQLLLSQSLTVVFFYRLRGKDLLVKVLDNAKKQINGSNYVAFSLLETTMGGRMEGTFNFTDLDYKKGKEVVARVKELSNGQFSGVITKGGNGAVSTVAPEGKLFPGAALLFQDVETKLSVGEKNDIFSQTGFYYDASKKELLPTQGADIRNYKQFLYKVFPIDMNHDGMEEIFVQSQINYNPPRYMAYFKKANTFYAAGFFDMRGANDLCMFPTMINGYNVLLTTLDAEPVKIYTFDGQQYQPTTNYKINKQDLATSVGLLSQDYTHRSTKETNQAASPKNTLPKGSLSKGAALLFKGVKCNLSADEKNAAFEVFGFDVSKDGKQFMVADVPEDPFNARVACEDLNRDGKQEIFIVYGNSYTSGITGSSVLLLIRDGSGAFKPNLDFPAAEYGLTNKMNKGFPDIQIYGRGFEVPTWRWNGKEYVFYKSEKVK